MNTILLLAIFFVALYILARVEWRLGAGGPQTPYELPVQRGMLRTVDSLAEDAIHLWRLRCAGRQASRRAVVRRGEMSHYRWTQAVRLLEHLDLDSGDDAPTYAEGIERIERYVAEQRRLAATPTYVAPWQ